MGRFNWMWQFIRKASIVGVICMLAITTTPKVAKALDVTNDTFSKIGDVEACEIWANVVTANKYAYVKIVLAGSRLSTGRHVKDKYWVQGNVSQGHNYTPFADYLNGCVTSGGTITNLVQTGFTAESFAAENFIGFSYTLNGTSYTL